MSLEDDAIARVIADRRAQGLPERLADPGAAHRVAAVLLAAPSEVKAKPRPRSRTAA